MKVEKKSLEIRLQESEDRYQEMLDLLPDIIFEIDGDLNITYVNSIAFDQFGYSREDFDKGLNVTQMIIPSELERARTNILNIFQGAIIGPSDYLLKKKDGSVFFARINARPIYKNGTIIGMRGIISDISSRKAAEAALRDSQAKFDALFNQSIYIYYLTDFNGNFIDVNDTALELLGYLREEVSALNFTALLDENQLPLALEAIKEIREKGSRLTTDIYKLRKKNGEYLWVETQGSLIYRNGKPYAIQGIARDITEKREALEKLKESYDNLQALFNSIDDFVFIFDLDGSILKFNFSVPYRLGYSKEELLSKNCFDLHPPNRRDDAIKTRANINAGKTDLCTIPLMTKKGTLIPVETKMTRGHWGNQEVTIGISRDITPYKKMERLITVQRDLALRILEITNFTEALKVSLHAILEVTAFDGGGIYIANEETGALTLKYHEGLSDSFIQKSRHYASSSPNVKLIQQGKPVYIDYRKLLEALKIQKDIEGLKTVAVIPIIDKDRVIGCLNVASYTLKEIPEESKKIIETLAGQIGQIINRFHLASALQESEEKFQLIAENANDLITVFNDKFEYEYTNTDAFERVMGYTKEELAGKMRFDVIHPDDLEAALKILKRGFASGVASAEIRIKHKQRHYIWFELRGRTFYDNTGNKKALIIGREISERKALDESRKRYLKDLEKEVDLKTKKLQEETDELQKALLKLKTFQEQLVQSEKLASIGLLTAGIAHEINNPIMGIINYAAIIKDEIANTPEIDLNSKPFSFIPKIIKEGERISTIVEDLFTFARKDIGKFSYEEISKVIQSSLSLLHSKIKRSQIEVTLNLIEDIPKIPMNSQKIQQVIINVIQNSITAIDKKFDAIGEINSKKILINTVLVTRGQRKYGRITFIDNGYGIKQNELNKIFDPFYTTKNDSKQKGMGLGLSISYGIIKEHDGYIEIKSEWKKYTIVNILLPVKISSNAKS